MEFVDPDPSSVHPKRPSILKTPASPYLARTEALPLISISTGRSTYLAPEPSATQRRTLHPSSSSSMSNTGANGADMDAPAPHTPHPPSTPQMAYRDDARGSLSLNDGDGDSPLESPALISDRGSDNEGGSDRGAEDDDSSLQGHPAGLLTPPQIAVGHTEPILLDSPDSSPFAGLNMNMGNNFERRATYHGGSPLLSPQHIGGGGAPKRLWPAPQVADRISPPTTPKGHPVRDGYFTNAVRQLYPISKPRQAPKYTTTLSYLLRVPRRYRPALLLGFCIVSFVLMFATRDTSLALHVQRVHESGIGRRFVDSAYWDGSRETVLRQVGEDDIDIATPSNVPEVPHFLNAQDEYAALISFVTSSTVNSLPPVDGSRPIDPAVVLDFDFSSEAAQDDMDLLRSEIHAIYPLVLFGRMRDPWHREIRHMLAEYKITPAPLIVDVDQRRDHAVFAAVLARILGTTELPQLVLEGKSLGSYHDVLALREKGTLKSTLEADGVLSVRNAKKKKKGVRERERIENERILGPAPIVDGE